MNELSLIRKERAYRVEVYGNTRLHFSNHKIQDPIYSVEVRYEAITGHVAQ